MEILRDHLLNAYMGTFQARMEVTQQFAAVFFKPRAWNDIKRAGLFAGGEKWRIDYLHLRFTMYAFGQLGYRGRGFPPLVDTGRLRTDALLNSWTEVRVTSSIATLTMHISTPMMLDHDGNTTGLSYAANRMVYDVLRAVTPREVDMIAMTTERTMMALIEGANPTVSRKGTVRGSLTKTQRESISHTKRPQRPGPTRRAA